MFSYLGVLISVIMGLAATYLLVGVSEVIHMRHTIRIYWVHLVWTANVLVYVLALWWEILPMDVDQSTVPFTSRRSLRAR